MAYDSMISWETALDITGIFLCSLIMAYLVYHRCKYRRRSNDACSKSRKTDVDANFTHQMVKQQVERISILVCRTLIDELRVLQKMTDIDATILFQPVSTVAGSNSSGVTDIQSGGTDLFPEKHDGDPYSRLSQLSAKGLSIQQIAESVKIPREEIELFFKLHKDGGHAGKKQRSP